MEYLTGYLMALVVIAAGFLALILALIVLEVSRPKFVFALILSLIVIGLGGYYYYVVSQVEKGVANPNILNSVLKISSTAAPVVVMSATVPQTAPAVANEKPEAAKPAPLGVKVKRGR